LPRLIATDLDGTLLSDDLVISQRTARVLRRTVACGATIVLVTGRSLRNLSQIYADLKSTYLAISANGAVVYDPAVDAVRSCQLLEPANVHEVCMRLRDRMPEVVFAAEVDFGRRLMYEPKWPFFHDPGRSAFSAHLDEITGVHVVKLMARVSGYDSETFGKIVIGSVGDLVEATCPGYYGLVEMSRLGVNKASALAKVAGELGIPPADVLAFGDMPNDVGMLRWAGHSVAVANAHVEALAAAGDTTLSNSDDGVAAYLEHLLAAVS
jgi:hydroxymethylpyrimidine pyrophosphatase-like HAD family hydrolase